MHLSPTKKSFSPSGVNLRKLANVSKATSAFGDGTNNSPTNAAGLLRQRQTTAVTGAERDVIEKEAMSASATGPGPTLHLSYDGWKADAMEWDPAKEAWVVWRMLPQGRYHYYFTDNSPNAEFEHASDLKRAMLGFTQTENLTGQGESVDAGSAKAKRPGVKTVSVQHSIQRLVGLPIPECNTIDITALGTPNDTARACKMVQALPRCQQWADTTQAQEVNTPGARAAEGSAVQ